MNLNSEPTEPRSRYIPLLQPGQEPMPNEEKRDEGVFIEHKNPNLGGNLRFMFFRMSQEDLESVGNFVHDGYVLGEPNRVSDETAAKRGLFRMDVELISTEATIDTSRKMRVTLSDSGNSIHYSSILIDARDHVDPNSPKTYMSAFDWERQEEPLGASELFMPIDQKVLEKLQYSVERYDTPNEGGEAN